MGKLPCRHVCVLYPQVPRDMFKGRTRTVKHNGANPMWRHRLEVEVVEPSIAILFIAVCHHVRHVVGVARHEVVCEPQVSLTPLAALAASTDVHAQTRRRDCILRRAADVPTTWLSAMPARITHRQADPTIPAPLSLRPQATSGERCGHASAWAVAE